MFKLIYFQVTHQFYNFKRDLKEEGVLPSWQNVLFGFFLSCMEHAKHSNTTYIFGQVLWGAFDLVWLVGSWVFG